MKVPGWALAVGAVVAVVLLMGGTANAAPPPNTTTPDPSPEPTPPAKDSEFNLDKLLGGVGEFFDKHGDKIIDRVFDLFDGPDGNGSTDTVVV